jgi:hypothetical protein
MKFSYCILGSSNLQALHIVENVRFTAAVSLFQLNWYRKGRARQYRSLAVIVPIFEGGPACSN